MKKTLSINIGSKVFNIDNDAYELLKKYLELNPQQNQDPESFY